MVYASSLSSKISETAEFLYCSRAGFKLFKWTSETRNHAFLVSCYEAYTRKKENIVKRKSQRETERKRSKLSFSSHILKALMNATLYYAVRGWRILNKHSHTHTHTYKHKQAQAYTYNSIGLKIGLETKLVEKLHLLYTCAHERSVRVR